MNNLDAYIDNAGNLRKCSIAGLSGTLADDQHVIDAEVLAVAAALVHAARHANGGADEISVAGLSGELADRQPSKCGNSTLGWTAGKLLEGAGAGSNPTEVDAFIKTGAQDLTVATFQSVPATGTCDNPENVNDNNTTTYTTFGTNGLYIEVEWVGLRSISQFRYYSSDNVGVWKLQYYNVDIGTHVWVDWVTDIPNIVGWSEWNTSGGEVLTYKVRLTLVSGGENTPIIRELEVKY